jgi:SAM-dependent methyltransferase
MDFYNQLSPFYHLVYPDWEASIKRQAADLDAIIKEFFGDGTKRILDVTCGIGTQTLGLAQLGYDLTASDISGGAIERGSMSSYRLLICGKRMVITKKSLMLSLPAIILYLTCSRMKRYCWHFSKCMRVRGQGEGA